jgi:integrase
MNDVLNINYSRVRKYQPEKVRNKPDRAYTRGEIQTLLEKADYRGKSMILLMSSSGLRVGALTDLKLRNLIPIDRYNIFKVVAYEGTRSQYYSFTSPECRKAIEKYFDYRKRCGESLTDDSYVFRGELNYRRHNLKVKIKHRHKPLSTETIRQSITEL